VGRMGEGDGGGVGVGEERAAGTCGERTRRPDGGASRGSALGGISPPGRNLAARPARGGRSALVSGADPGRDGGTAGETPKGGQPALAQGPAPVGQVDAGTRRTLSEARVIPCGPTTTDSSTFWSAGKKP